MMINLFEYQNRHVYNGDEDDYQKLELFLDEIWHKRGEGITYRRRDEDCSGEQQILQFLYRTREIKSRRYAGLIRFQGETINLLPKIFYQEDVVVTPEKIEGINLHILWWLQYSKRIKFPNYQTALSDVGGDFLEILIFLFAKYTRNLLAQSIMQQYQQREEPLSFIKGRINIDRYLKNHVARGEWHKIDCVYEPFIIDNLLNRAVKYVANLLINHTKNPRSKKYLREILFTLDEVSDTPVTPEECCSIQFNPAFEDFRLVRDYCLLFLKHSISFSYKNDLKLFAFLIPMDILFEDFITGFIEQEIPEINLIAQERKLYLDHKHQFAIRPDLQLMLNGQKIIADIKYKMRDKIDREDIYQMIAYAIRLKVSDIALLYPQTILKKSGQFEPVEINDQFSEEMITIRGYHLPVINDQVLNGNLKDSNTLFKETELKLKESILKIF